MTPPAVTVLMATYNGAALVGETIESVLRQDFRDFELIVVDDCSTDSTLKVVGGFRDRRIRVLSTPMNMGPVGARNFGFLQAQGDHIAALDQDDLCQASRLAAQYRFLQSEPSVVAVGTAASLLVGRRERSDNRPARTTPDFLRWMLNVSNPLVWSSMMLRGSAARRLEPFSREAYRFAEDFDLYHRLAELGDIARLDEALTVYRCHEGGASRRYRAGMRASAASVLARVYTPLFGAQAGARAALMTRHLSGGEPVPDLAALDDIAQVLLAVRRTFEARGPDPTSRALVAQHMSEQWWRAAHAGVRAGALSAREVLAHRPAFARSSGAAGLLSCGLVGTARARLGVSRAPGENGPSRRTRFSARLLMPTIPEPRL